jgi:hypothetical protein
MDEQATMDQPDVEQTTTETNAQEAGQTSSQREPEEGKTGQAAYEK